MVAVLRGVLVAAPHAAQSLKRRALHLRWQRTTQCQAAPSGWLISLASGMPTFINYAILQDLLACLPCYLLSRARLNHNRLAWAWTWACVVFRGIAAAAITTTTTISTTTATITSSCSSLGVTEGCCMPWRVVTVRGTRVTKLSLVDPCCPIHPSRRGAAATSHPCPLTGGPGGLAQLDKHRESSPRHTRCPQDTGGELVALRVCPVRGICVLSKCSVILSCQLSIVCGGSPCREFYGWFHDCGDS